MPAGPSSSAAGFDAKEAAKLRVASSGGNKTLRKELQREKSNLSQGQGLLSRQEFLRFWLSLDMNKIEKDPTGEAGMELNELHKQWSDSSGGGRRRSSIFSFRRSTTTSTADSDSDSDCGRMPTTSLLPVPREVG